MPIQVPAISRRRFLAATAAVGAGLVRRWGFAADGDQKVTDSHRFALLADIHLAADPATLGLGVNMFDHFRRVSDELLRFTPAPSAVLIAGDCAFQSGEVGE